MKSIRGSYSMRDDDDVFARSFRIDLISFEFRFKYFTWAEDKPVRALTTKQLQFFLAFLLRMYDIAVSNLLTHAAKILYFNLRQYISYWHWQEIDWAETFYFYFWKYGWVRVCVHPNGYASVNSYLLYRKSIFIFTS